MKNNINKKHISYNMNLLKHGLIMFIIFAGLYVSACSINGIQLTKSGLYINLDSTVYGLIKLTDNKYIQFNCN